MTHYSHHSLHLGCGEPLGNALVSAVSVKNTEKVRTTSNRCKSEQEKRVLKKKT